MYLYNFKKTLVLDRPTVIYLYLCIVLHQIHHQRLDNKAISFFFIWVTKLKSFWTNPFDNTNLKVLFRSFQKFQNFQIQQNKLHKKLRDDRVIAEALREEQSDYGEDEEVYEEDDIVDDESFYYDKEDLVADDRQTSR